jgi:hypothetical protein
MSDTPNADARPTDQPTPKVRKPWHAPEFIVTDLASTDAICNGGLDGGPMTAQS